MIRCSHCGYKNNNAFLCGGCGNELNIEEQIDIRKRPEGSVNFLNEVVDSIDRIFPAVDDIKPLQAGRVSISMTEMAKESGMLVIDNERWRPIEAETAFRAFLADMFLIIGLSIGTAALSLLLMGTTMFMAVKIYFVVYFFVSFLVWFLFPYLFESSPMALVLYDLTIIKGVVMRMKGDTASFMMLWIMSLLYSFLPVFVIEYIVFLASSEKFQPFIFQLMTIKYIQKTD